jgi:hypothetical protein
MGRRHILNLVSHNNQGSPNLDEFQHENHRHGLHNRQVVRIVGRRHIFDLVSHNDRGSPRIHESGASTWQGRNRHGHADGRAGCDPDSCCGCCCDACTTMGGGRRCRGRCWGRRCPGLIDKRNLNPGGRWRALWERVLNAH